jgi:hypothetical protein
MLRAQVRVWVPVSVMKRAQARMVQGTGPEASGLAVMLRSDFYESHVPLQVLPMPFPCLDLAFAAHALLSGPPTQSPS